VRDVEVVVLAGDGIGPEVVAEARRVVDTALEPDGVRVVWRDHLVGGISIDEYGTALTDDVLAACHAADAVLLGAVGGPKWDTTDPARPRPEQGLLGLRQGLGLFANLRPVRIWPSLADASPLRPERIAGTDLLVVRELTGGLYFGESAREGDRAFDTMVYTRNEIERVAVRAFEAARGRRQSVTSVDKANVLESSRLWREVVEDVALLYPEIALDHVLVDNAAMQLVSRPSSFDVIVTENMFGDILSDEAAMISGSIGLLASASLGDGSSGLYEPVHGSAPDIAGRGVANPVATCLSAALMLRHSLGAHAAADRVEAAVDQVIERGPRTPDLGGDAGTRDVGTAIAAAIAVG
jgi:3-isopropylmalate dehydrogenase